MTLNYYYYTGSSVVSRYENVNIPSFRIIDKHYYYYLKTIEFKYRTNFINIVSESDTFK